MSALAGKQILVLEDEALVAMLLEDTLREAGADVLGPANSVAEAFGLLRDAESTRLPDAVVVDLNLAGESAIPFADAMAHLHVPILFQTGCRHGCDIGGHGSAPVILKPYDMRDIVSALRLLTQEPSTPASAVRSSGAGLSRLD